MNTIKTSYVPVTEKAKQLRAELKKLGYNRNHVSVVTDSSTLSDSIDITIKKEGVNKSLVETIANKFRNIDRCEASGEILGGGNTFVFVR